MSRFLFLGAARQAGALRTLTKGKQNSVLQNADTKKPRSGDEDADIFCTQHTIEFYLGQIKPLEK